MVSTSVLFTHLGMGNTMDLPTTFKVLALVDGIRGPIAHLTRFIPHYTKFVKKMKKIQKFIDMKEVPEECLVDQTPDSEFAINIDKNSFSWGCKLDKDEDTSDEDEKKVEEEYQP